MAETKSTKPQPLRPAQAILTSRHDKNRASSYVGESIRSPLPFTSPALYLATILKVNATHLGNEENMDRVASPTNTTEDDYKAHTLTDAQSSIFTDSALDMDIPMPVHVDSDVEHFTQPELSSQTTNSSNSVPLTVFDRLQRLGTKCATFERDDTLSDIKRRKLDHTLAHLEVLLDDEETDSVDSASNPQSIPESGPDQAETPTGCACNADENPPAEMSSDVTEADLSQVRVNLTAAMQSMRLRQQEQRHLHQLTVQKVEAVAQRCLFQEQQIQALVEEMRSLRVENQTLGHENDRLKESVAQLESEASMKEVAVSAMTSAVAGLEGWIKDANSVYAGNQEPNTVTQSSRQRRTVIRGKGRFRGRHYVDDRHGVPSHDLAGQDVQELQDGVRAWIRGFKDVEDACNAPIVGRMKEVYRTPATLGEDDWGDFETPSSFAH